MPETFTPLRKESYAIKQITSWPNKLIITK